MRLPGSKSITNRDLILAALAPGTSVLAGVLHSDDTRYMMDALRQLGFPVTVDGTTVTVQGGIHQLRAPGQPLFLGNSGTSTRFLTGLSVLNQGGSITLTGDVHMQRRPIQDLVDGIRQLGLVVDAPTGRPPLTIHGGQISQDVITMRGSSSSQYFTALLQVAPLFPQGLTIIVEDDLVSKPYIKLTISEMAKFGVSVHHQDYQRFVVEPQSYQAQSMVIEGDASALSYVAAWLVLHGGTIEIENLSSDTCQGDYGFLYLLEPLGLQLDEQPGRTVLQAPGLQKRSLPGDVVGNTGFESMPDVSMTYMILAPFLPGETWLVGLQTLNKKECRRIDAMADNLRALGVAVTHDETKMSIGERPSTIPQGVAIDSHEDHRIAMCFGTLDSYLQTNMQISTPECVGKTYPDFWGDLEQHFFARGLS